MRGQSNYFPWMTILFLAGIACAKDFHPIPDGTYVASKSEQRITVTGSTIHFYVRLNESSAGPGMLERTYQYTVLRDGRVQPYPVRSADAVFGIGKFDWYWDGEKILQRDPRSAELITSFIHVSEDK